ncbi:MAG: 16S rRNA (guanine(966)-N(2))-methyltransferase RsmD [Candidatus Aminicenantes bacterium]|nr:16S rRNA (guanine(966)-N(2))-methyltransferase RsmD [Candidatus Aminicenantes bacterium]
MIRVISGLYKGKKLKNVSGSKVRPLPGRLKESLFSIIQENVRGSLFLDGFAGTGSAGIEALSRGADYVVFIEEYYPAVKVIHSNLEKCGAEEKSRVIHGEFNRSVIHLSKEEACFDVIFLDPPYRLLENRNPLKVIRKRGILKKNGLIVIRHHRKIRFSPKDFKKSRQVTMGDDILAFFINLDYSGKQSE